MNDEIKNGLLGLKIAPEQRRKKSRKGRYVLFIIIFFAVSMVFGWNYFRVQSPTEVGLFTVKAPEKEGVQSVLSASGYVTPRRRATIASVITGRVTALFVEEGMVVTKGQVLARLDDVDAQKRYDSSLADLKVAEGSLNELSILLTNAERNLQRVTNLLERNMSTQREFDDQLAERDAIKARLELAIAQIESAQSRVSVFKQELENYVVKAPFSGIAVSKDAEVGEMVSPVSAGGGYTRTGISTIVDMDSLEVEVDVNESYIARVTVGQKVQAVLDAYPDWEIPASVRTIIPTADRQKATVKVRIQFDQLNDKILPDMGVKVSFFSTESERQEDTTLKIPKEALVKAGGQNFTFVSTGERAEKRTVSIGKAFGNRIEVLSGLIAGDRVVISGLEKLKDGMAITEKK